MKDTEDKEWNEFVAKMKHLSLPELEELIKEQFKVFQRSRMRKDWKLDLCLDQRKYLINSTFKFTPKAVSHIERVNRILTESTAKLLQRARLLYEQMVKLKQQGDEFLDDFNVDGTIRVSFNGDGSVLTFDDDENNGQSNYIAMAEILDCTLLAFENLRAFYFSYDDNPESQKIDEDRFKDDMLKLNWNIELLSAPELSSIDYFCYASHILFVDSNYSISDAIRVNDIWNEVNVRHQNWGERRSIP
jgi:hypothetical protein